MKTEIKSVVITHENFDNIESIIASIIGDKKLISVVPLAFMSTSKLGYMSQCKLLLFLE